MELRQLCRNSLFRTAGDAAHLDSPAGGQGLNAGLADADMLTRTLLARLTSPIRLTASSRHTRPSGSPLSTSTCADLRTR